jgi:hypothetical protein
MYVTLLLKNDIGYTGLEQCMGTHIVIRHVKITRILTHTDIRRTTQNMDAERRYRK